MFIMLRLSHYSYLFSLVLFLVLTALSRIYSLSVIEGSGTEVFSLAHSIVPLSGLFGGIAGSGALAFIRLMYKMACAFIVSGTFPLYKLAHVIPGLCASLYFAIPQPFYRVGLPLVCMSLFIAHPVGSQAHTYSFYWFIPLIVYFFKLKGRFSQALASTFTAHAVGSVLWIWLYPVSLPATLWIGLIPLVAIERLLYASTMVLASYAIECIAASGARSKAVVQRVIKRLYVT